MCKRIIDVIVAVTIVTTLNATRLPQVQGQVWDLNANAKAHNDAGNGSIIPFGPEDAWTYGFGPSPGSESPLGFVQGTFTGSLGFPFMEFFEEAGDPGPNRGLIAFNDKQPPDDLFVFVDPGLTLMTLGNWTHPAKVRWTAPSDLPNNSNTKIRGKFSEGHFADKLIAVVKNDTYSGDNLLFNKVYAYGDGDQMFDLQTSIGPGDTIDFVLRESSNYSVSHLGLDAVITIEAATLAGDYNGNGAIDAADYTIWRDHLGQSFSLSNENPDAITPGFVDDEDYTFWKQQFGGIGIGSVTAGVGAVPEPSTYLLLVISLVTPWMWRNRK